MAKTSLPIGSLAIPVGWPDKAERNERLEAGSEIIRALLADETATSNHPQLKTEQAKLWSLPTKPPLAVGRGAD
ncbi:hypothetical protein ACOJBO_00870 [Rhizobium beringeri]